jgi:YHS domain-containing protein
MRSPRKTLVAAAILAFAGCVTGPSKPDSRPVACDPVCAYYNDLGCIDVRVDEKTPCFCHGGKTYYFCTERCRARFEKNPEKFVAHAEGR